MRGVKLPAKRAPWVEAGETQVLPESSQTGIGILQPLLRFRGDMEAALLQVG